MKRNLGLVVMVMTCTAVSASAYDHIIFRDARESDGKVVQLGNDKIVFQDSSNMENSEITPAGIYMISIEKQGNVYFNEEGKRWTGESESANPSKTDIIYLAEGQEIAASKVRMTQDEVCFIPRKKWKGLKNLFSKSDEVCVSRDAVFLIKYQNGIVDIVTPFAQAEPEEIVPETKTVVKFHEFKAGDTLDSIAKTYGVSVDEIVEWNDLKKIRGKYSLGIGTQLLIYVNQ